MSGFLEQGDEPSVFMKVENFAMMYYNYSKYFLLELGTRGGVVVKALRYKPAGRGFDSRWCHWNF